ncbi:hypothetical protein BOX15_Mlig011400g1, partial [Macrostomum lignano]
SNRSAELEPALRPLTLGHVGFPSHPSERGLNTDSATVRLILHLHSVFKRYLGKFQCAKSTRMSRSLPLRLPVLLALLLALTTLAAAAGEGSGNSEGRDGRRRDSRVHDAPPSDAEHHDDDDDGDDAEDGEGDRDGGRRKRRHDARYDHESFLGRDESRRLDEMSPEESQKKLAELFAKVDKNNDTKLSLDEMEAWLAEIAHQEREKQAESRFHSIKAAISAKDMNSSLSLEDWKKAMHHEVIGDEPADKETEATFAQTMAKDAARWVKADANADKKLDKAEFADFMFAEHSPRMKDVVVQEALNASDVNRDGRIDLAEYMRELFPDYEKEKREGKKLPKWVVKEEEFFKMNLDLNKDGSLDADEVYKWIVPEDIDHSKRESKHLFEAADEDRDKFLSKDEVMKNWETFVGHRATHYGEFAPSSHDEL